MITIKQLEAFYWAVELGSLEAAALRLNTSPSAISKRLQELESALGFSLFDRSIGRTHVTAHGATLGRLAAEALRIRSRIMSIGQTPTRHVETVKVGVTELTAMTWLPNLVQRTHRMHPELVLEPSVESSISLVEKMKGGELDIVIVPDAFLQDEMTRLTLAVVEYVWLCTPDYLGKSESLTLQQLAEHTIIEQRYGSGLGLLINGWLSHLQVDFEHTLASSSLVASTSLTLGGLGICYLPRDLFAREIASGALHIVHCTAVMPHVPYVLLYNKARVRDALRHVAAIATDTCSFSKPLASSIPR